MTKFNNIEEILFNNKLVPVATLNNIENAITDIFMFIQYFKKLEDIDFFRVYMDFAKEKK